MLWLFFNFYKPLTVLERHKAQDAAMYPYLKKTKKKNLQNSKQTNSSLRNVFFEFHKIK